ncbi:nucleotidyltransferase [Streptomyces sp. NA02950]|uniref:nucleotidyltransferase n=1 Tax=Streptomyces sp. NA02950 TaxID=2742137 RepID=UPI0015918753|nr:nucleotidyltransferase [Streptomyces sp. NA02950]QKV90748.1 nucleotidyltransferase [Streptomyces sp. NA02950]
MSAKGLEKDGTIAREGALSRVSEAFDPVIVAARALITEMFDSTRLHSAYVYGSIPRGAALPGISDLDLLLALRHEPTEADRADTKTIEATLDRSFTQIDGVGILLSSARALLSDLERYDGGFFVACLCTPLLGGDLAERLPRYRPTALLARETNGDLSLALPRWRTRAAEAATEADRKTLSRLAARKVARTGFTLVMPRWGGWTSDLGESAELFGRYYPRRREQMRLAAATGRTPSADPAVLSMLIDDLGPWLAAEYTAVHGEKAPRPEPA